MKLIKLLKNARLGVFVLFFYFKRRLDKVSFQMYCSFTCTDGPMIAAAEIGGGAGWRDIETMSVL